MEKNPETFNVAIHGRRIVIADNTNELPVQENSDLIVTVDKCNYFGKVIPQPKKSCCSKKSCCKIEKGALKGTILRLATSADISISENNEAKEKAAFPRCKAEIQKQGLPMKLVDVEYQFDGGKITFYFTADQRVDFRELVKSLAGMFRTRIELRQIGVRDAAKIINGIGVCGKPQCCSSFMREFAQITTQHAKDQQLSLNPSKISGNCGRLLCCLQFEEEDYLNAYKKLPRAGGQFVDESGKKGDIVFVDTFQDRIHVRRFEKGINTFQWYSQEEIEKGTIHERTEYNR